MVDARDHRWVTEYWRVREEARASGNTASVVQASEELVLRTVSLVLTRMGEPSPSDRVLPAIRRAQELQPGHPEAFPNRALSGSPKLALEWLYRAMWWLDEADVSGQRLVLPHHSDYRDLDHLANEIVDCVVTLLTAVAAPKEPVPQVVDYEEGKSLVRQELASELPAGETMRRIISQLRTRVSTEPWDAFDPLPFEEEVNDKRCFLLDVFPTDSSLPVPEGFDFVISTPVRDGLVTYDVEVAAGLAYDPDDYDWPSVPEWQPRDSWVRSRVLAGLYDLGKRTGSLDSGAQIVALGYALVLGRELAREYKHRMGLARVGVCAGFSSDTPTHLGWV